jgi:single-stranded-DNA-specific exonuclease
MPPQPRWIPSPPRDANLETALARELAVAPFVASILSRRGIGAALAQSFLFPKLKSLSDPFLLPNMDRAIERILAAIDAGERIVLYGDYDVDGVTSLALFTRVLRAFGAAPQCFLPHRMDEGYGLSPEGVNRCVSELNPQLLIALDCGTSSANEIATLNSRGVDAIVFDHHECKTSLPDCIALVNPKLDAGADTPADFRYLCSAGLVFKACHALLKRRPVAGIDLRDYLDIVALGTVADIVPLVHENRVLVQKGLARLENSRWPGVRALVEIAAVRAPVRAGDVGFRLGPRLNAAGRLGTARDALELLLTDDASRARELAVSLDSQNSDRQVVEQRILRLAEQQLQNVFDQTRDAAIVVGDADWHPGVLGIVASRLCRAHHRPTLVVGFDETGVGKGSGRSIEGLSLVKVLAQCGEFLEKFGGHEMAAGLTIRRERFDKFQRAFRECARAMLTDDQLQPRLHLDAELDLAELDFDFLSAHELLQPFGIGNPQPLFFTRRVAPAAPPRVLKEKHLAFQLRQNGRSHAAIFFNGAEVDLPPAPWDIAFKIERNEYRDAVSVQIQMQFVRAAE